MRHGLHDRVAGAQLRLLQNPEQIRRIDGRAHGLAAVAIDETERLGARLRAVSMTCETSALPATG
jgi:hypothetical protein